MKGRVACRTGAPRLGDLELAVMGILWRGRGADAKSVASALVERDITLSTIQSTLERLHRKRLVNRRKTGRAYHYTTSVSRTELIGLLIREVAEQVSFGKMEPLLSGFVDLVEADEPELMDRLERIVADRRLGRNENE